MELSVDEAIARLPNKEEVHTFRNSNGMLCGADWLRDEIIRVIKGYGGANLTGEIATSMNNGICIEWKDDWLFIETINNEINLMFDTCVSI